MFGLEMAFLVLVTAAAITDFLTLKIPNRLVLAILLLFVPYAVLAYGEIDIVTQVGIGLVALAIGAGLFFTGLMGGGDAKLMAVVMLWMPSEGLWNLLLMIALAGGAIALAFMVLQRAAIWMFMLVPATASWPMPLSIAKKGTVPYGIAIAIGTHLALFFPQPIAG